MWSGEYAGVYLRSSYISMMPMKDETASKRLVGLTGKNGQDEGTLESGLQEEGPHNRSD